MIFRFMTLLALLFAAPAFAAPDLGAILKGVPDFQDNFDTGLAPGMWDRGLSPWPETIGNRILPGTNERQIFVDQKYLGSETLSTQDKYNTGGTAILMARRIDTGLRNRIAEKVKKENPSQWHKDAINKASWASAALKSRKSFMYGYVEASIRLDVDESAWPAFWMLPAKWGWPPEVDIVEFKYENGIRMAVMGIHSTDKGWKNAGTRVPVPNNGYGFHTYGFAWDKNFSYFYIDRKLVHTMKTPADLNQPFYPILSLAMEGWGKPSTVNTKPNQVMQVNDITHWKPVGG